MCQVKSSFKILFMLSFCITALGASRPFSGLNIKDFLDVQKSLVDWGENPFIQHEDDTDISGLTLFAVVYSKKNSAALINDQVVRTGDKIGKSEVVFIDKSEVVLRNENGIFKLSFKRKKNEKS